MISGLFIWRVVRVRLLYGGLYDEVVALLARLFRILRIDAIAQPVRVFTEAS